MWDKEAVRKYEAWFATPRGAYAFHMECLLLEQALSAWPRRHQKLLEIGCGPGFFLDRFWRAGFAVSGVDGSPAMIDAARARVGEYADLHLAQADHLPFDDKEFDFAAILTMLEFHPDPAKVIAEAARVARKGLLICFLNRLSFYYLTNGRKRPDSSNVLRQAHWFTPCEMRRLIRDALGPRQITPYSVLAGPPLTWRKGFAWRLLNGQVQSLSIGSYVGYRVDFIGDRVVTPLLDFKAQPRPSS